MPTSVVEAVVLTKVEMVFVHICDATVDPGADLAQDKINSIALPVWSCQYQCLFHMHAMSGLEGGCRCLTSDPCRLQSLPMKAEVAKGF